MNKRLQKALLIPPLLTAIIFGIAGAVWQSGLNESGSVTIGPDSFADLIPALLVLLSTPLIVFVAVKHLDAAQVKWPIVVLLATAAGAIFFHYVLDNLFWSQNNPDYLPALAASVGALFVYISAVLIFRKE